MKNITLFCGLFFLSILGFYSSCSEEELEERLFTIKNDYFTQKERITYRTLVYVDKRSVDYYSDGNEMSHRLKMVQFFEYISDFFSKASDDLNNHYVFEISDFKVYDGNSTTLQEQVYDYDTELYDFVAIFDGFMDYGEEESQLYHVGSVDGRSVVMIGARGLDEPTNLFVYDAKKGEDAMYKSTAHEFGHFRGLPDLYFYIVNANQVNGILYQPENDIMRYANEGVWNEYSALLLNYTASSRMTSYSKIYQDAIPSSIELKVTKDGEPVSEAVLTFYGYYRNQNKGIIHDKAIVQNLKTDDTGIAQLGDIPLLLKTGNSSIGASSWLGLLVKVEVRSEVKYLWLPDYELQKTYLKSPDVLLQGAAIYKNTIKF